MAIKILPARLANQIAAGEVVERPASVVKELVENSIDSGATRIDVDIEKGGSKLIRVRDNGSGIEKDELGLALSRHATSKIHSLDDLEAILSLGFRGEALASISSVSRLTLTSRTATQGEAWSAYAEGRDMAVQLTPAAHPVGTTVEVVDLFFNTPARRKFLRTEKTEFTHIDELLKRIALSCFSVSITLRHNGKVIRQYRAAKTDIQIEKRVAAVCGSNFMEHAVAITLDHDDLKLKGWITTPDGARSQSDLQYCYVNGRMMRDKLINHAIRQSYESALRPEQFATYVLFIEIDPHQVDVNVHPAKHEVRFHQARLVHDFIYQALSDALAQSIELVKPMIAKSAYAITSPSNEQGGAYSIQELSLPTSAFKESTPQNAWASDDSQMSRGKGKQGQTYHPKSNSSDIQRKQSDAYRALFEPISPAPCKYEHVVSEIPDDSQSTGVEGHDHAPTKKRPQPNALSQHKTIEIETTSFQVTELGKALAIIEGQCLLMQNSEGCLLVDVNKAAKLRVEGQLRLIDNQALKSQPLLIPLNIPMTLDDMTVVAVNHLVFSQLGLELKAKGKTSVMVMGVPQPLRQQNLQQLLPELFNFIKSQPTINQGLITQWITSKIVEVKSQYTLSEAIQIVSDLEHIWGKDLPFDHYHWIQPVDFSAPISALLS
ncbi:DNA mismatch repair endonuclease MutL [Vibrio rumoiensis]|uniref:DNA mismatch repair protein MutL n=1 Tax=Vibrio rumoiensis 1S-45 TaxID=1188252 RepID=A0A1E5E085_9VIBR|nr:DNA mismatch repair endonuclease MutL [Vibrio rumoiensis]OEF23465.1 DNA mismatch repair protein MutL [Vibrio rumoiensis 1S-45]